MTTSPIPDFALDTSTGDLAIDDLGAYTLTTSLLDEVAQRLQTTLQLFLGEWFLDTRLGMPYYRDVLIRAPDFAVIKAMFHDAITADVGIESLVKLELAFDSLTRKLSVSFEAVLNSGELLASTVETAA